MVRIVHIVGTGTIGEPLIGLMADNREAFGIDEVTFHKRTPLLRERGKVNDLVSRGAHLSVDQDRWAGFEDHPNGKLRLSSGVSVKAPSRSRDRGPITPIAGRSMVISTNSAS